VFLIGVLPGLGEAAVVPEDGSVVIPQFALLHVLSDGVVGLFGCNFHLGLGHFGDLNDSVVSALGAALQRDVVPGGNGGVALVEGETEGFRGGLSAGGGGVPVEDGGGDSADTSDGGGAPCRGGDGGGECQEGEWGC